MAKEGIGMSLTNKVLLNSKNGPDISISELKDLFEKRTAAYNINDDRFVNSEASVLWIIRGCMEYFDKLSSKFLGEGNENGIPSMEADCFSNNVYRLYKAMQYLSDLWGFRFSIDEEFKVLLDVRTLIVHSGEQLSNIQSLGLKEYKDSQLGRIIPKSDDCLSKLVFLQIDVQNADYILQIWNDKHDKKEKYHKSEIDYYLRNVNYVTANLCVNVESVKNIIFNQIYKFISNISTPMNGDKERNLPPIEYLIVKDKIDLKKIEKLISGDLRGGYSIENGEKRWYGYGLQKLLSYVERKKDISDKVILTIQKKIEDAVREYWKDYSDSSKKKEEISSLDIRQVFSDFTPNYEKKGYIEGEKLFIAIAPYFNSDKWTCKGDTEYLEEFVRSVNAVLDSKIVLETSIDDLICEYFVKSVEKKLNAL